MKRLLAAGFLLTVTILMVSSCQKELSEEDNSNLASFSLADDSSNCYGSVVNGDYYNGVSASRPTNYVAVTVNVKSTGSYTIATDSVNGYYFSDTGFFSKTGLDTLILRAHGTPILILTNEFSFPKSTCNFDVDVQDSTGTGLGGVDTSGSGTTTFEDSSYVDNSPAPQNTWHFTDSISGTTYSGTFVSNGTIDHTDNIYTLTLAGPGSDVSKAFGINLELPGGNVQTGIYEIPDSDNILGLYTIVDQGIVYQSDEDVAEDGLTNSYITITSYDAATKQIQGSFHCWTEDENGDNLTLIKGSFNTFVE